jgi:hypothetical protein
VSPLRIPWTPPPALSQSDIDALGVASGRMAEDRFGQVVARRGTSGNWVRPGSPFVSEEPFRAGYDFSSATRNERREMLNFLSASVLLHCEDAWTYFGRALGAMAQGSLSLAQHMLYYSELRAALSLLGRNGVYCIDRTNFVIDASGEVSRLSSLGTHQGVWRFFDGWGKTPAAAGAVASSIGLHGSDLAGWLDSRFGFSSASVMVPELFKKWGVDLGLYARDQKWRNYNSYSPQHLTHAVNAHSPAWLLDCMKDVWRLLIAGGSRPFGELDALLLRAAVRDAYAAQNGAIVSDQAFEGAVRRAAEQLVESPFVDSVTSLVSGRSSAGQSVLSYAQLRPRIGAPASITTKGMAGRALILLRLSTGNLEQMMRSAGVNSASLQGWADDLFTRTGLSPFAGLDDPLLDGYADVESELELLNDESPSFDQAGLAGLSAPWVAGYHSLSKVERVLAWSLVA